MTKRLLTKKEQERLKLKLNPNVAADRRTILSCEVSNNRATGLLF